MERVNLTVRNARMIRKNRENCTDKFMASGRAVGGHVWWGGNERDSFRAEGGRQPHDEVISIDPFDGGSVSLNFAPGLANFDQAARTMTTAVAARAMHVTRSMAAKSS